MKISLSIATASAKGPFKLELDVDAEVRNGKIVDREFLAHLKKLKLEHELVEEEGPAGGNPVVDVFGTKQNIRALLESWFPGDDEEIESFMSQIKRA